MTPHKRVFPVAGGRFIYGQAPEACDVRELAATLSSLESDAAIAHFENALGGALAVPVLTVQEIAALCSDGGSKTANFSRKRGESGWEVETWEPTWFCFDGAPLSCARPPAFAGADAPQVLAALGYSPGEVLGLKQSRAVVPTLWYAWGDEPHREPLSSPIPPSVTAAHNVPARDLELLKEGLE